MLKHIRLQLVLSILVVGALVAVTVTLTSRGSGTRSLILFCNSLTWFAVSALLASGQRFVQNKHATLRSQIKAVPVISFPVSELPQSPKACEIPRIVNAFSVDLEDYFHTEVAAQTVVWSQWDEMPSRLEHTLPRLLALLNDTQTRGTFFVLGWIAEKYPEMVREIAECGHEIACHSYRHLPVFRMTPQAFAEDTRIAKILIEDASGREVLGYRAPCFSITPGTEWAFDVLSELGFQYDSSINPVCHFFYGNPHAQRHPHFVGRHGLFEIPVATWRAGRTNLPVGGGAYLRILPYRYNERGLQSINQREKLPATLYMHPWEIDEDQPDLALPFLSTLRQRFGTGTMERRLRRLLTAHCFASIAEVYAGSIPGLPNTPLANQKYVTQVGVA